MFNKRLIFFSRSEVSVNLLELARQCLKGQFNPLA